ncbi:DUF7373 family lipoprotein [Mycolicibacterium llatzerense]|uniref:Lipoprotein n=1 Tax=Mycolicibacterium llatzerense TaxID=280871 RepID=A0A0D1L829_9MYCO|nr:hypothetical protein [Mycolicibacterium llatzerense]KIU17075.1 hypothetical protein TL10_09795 [Mycolicibacterium llatzerense]
MRSLVNCGAALVVAVLAAGCGGGSTQSSPATSSAKPATSTAPPPPAIVAPAQLKPGAYPTKAHEPYGTAGAPEVGAKVEAQQLAGYVVGPWEVDSTLTEPYLSTYFVIDAPGALAQFGPESIASAAGRHNFIDGFASARESATKSVLINGVLRFAGPADATAAASEMNAAALQLKIRGAEPKPVALPEHPDALASTYDVDSRGAKVTTARSFTARGPYVLIQLAQSTGGPDPAIALVAKAIGAQVRAIEPFKPAAELAAVPVDPTGLLALTLLTDAPRNSQNAVYSGTGALHFQSNPIASGKVFQDNGVTGFARGKTSVYQAKDPSSAVNVANAFGKEVSVDGTETADPVPALTLSRCILLANPKQFYCVAPAGNYAIEARGAELKDVHEQVAAQYILLTAKP